MFIKEKEFQLGNGYNFYYVYVKFNIGIDSV